MKIDEKIKEGKIISCIYTGIDGDTLLAKIAEPLNFKNKLGKSSNFLSLNILNTLKSKKVDSNTLEELESILISSDISLDVVNQLIESVKELADHMMM